MRLVARMAGTLVTVVAATTIGCGGGSSVAPIAPDSPELSLSVQVSKSSFVRGDSTKITVTLRNVSEHDVRVRFPTTCTILYAIRVDGGAIVLPSGGVWSCPAVASRIDLGPSQATQRTFTWKGEGLPAGSYVVYGALGETMATMTAGVGVTLLD
jgi:hypothetical protein